MSAINYIKRLFPVTKEYTLDSLKPGLESRVAFLEWATHVDFSQEDPGLLKKMASRFHDLTQVELEIEQLQRIPLEMTMEKIHKVKGMSIRETIVVRRDEKELQELKALQKAIYQEFKPASKSIGYSALKQMIRNFDEEGLKKSFPELEDIIPVMSQLGRIVTDAKRFVDLFINGEKVIDKIENYSDEEIKGIIAKKIGACYLSTSDFWKVLELSYQSSLKMGTNYYIQELNQLTTGIDSPYEINLQVENGRLVKLISTINLAFCKSEPDEDENSRSLIESGGKKRCVTICDFIRNKVTLKIKTIAFGKGEFAKTNLRRTS